MPAMDDWSDCLPDQMRSVWPLLALATRRIRGSLVGGTALAVHLRHRISFDLDYMAMQAFSGARLARSLEERATDFELIDAGADAMHARVQSVMVQVFRAPHRGLNPGHVKVLQAPARIDGLRVASLPDLLASKLDLIMYRPKLRDYIDLAAIDRAGHYRLEDGLVLHMERYGVTVQDRVGHHIIDLLESPGRLEVDPLFEPVREETLDYLSARAPELRRALIVMHSEDTDLRASDPPPGTHQSGLL